MIKVNEDFIPKFSEPSKRNLKEILNKHNNFQNEVRVINIVGTNGKGSTSYFTSLGLKNHYKKVGLFISPAFLFQNERIQINNQNISDEDFKRILELFKKDISDNHLNFFEIYTLIAMWYFYENKVDISVIEAGIGGKLDTTNLFANQIGTALTTLGLDHQELLGFRIEEIIEQKVGIAKSGFLVSSSDNKIYEQTILSHLKIKDIKFYQAEEYSGEKTFQKFNKGLVLKLFEVLNLNFDQDIFKLPSLLGRITLLNENPKLIIDGAHNVKGVEELVKSIKEQNLNPEIIFASSFKKNYHEEIKILQENFTDVFFAEFNEFENWNHEKKYPVIDWKEKIRNNMVIGRDTLVCGSLYFIPLVYEWFTTEG